MSSNLECEFVQVKEGEWFYLLQDWNAPVQCWDWREHATAYGPFRTIDQAEEHLDDNHANPGGWSVIGLEQGQVEAELCEAVADAIEGARRRARSEVRRSRAPRL